MSATKFEMTEWFPEWVKPVRTGIYETLMDFGFGYTYWDGNEWGNQGNDLEEAKMLMSAGMQNKRWRGLASDPNA